MSYTEISNQSSFDRIGSSVKGLIFRIILFVLCFLCSFCYADATVENKPLFVLDMVHHNPGESLYESSYNDPAVLKEMGYNGKVYYLFDSPQLAGHKLALAPWRL